MRSFDDIPAVWLGSPDLADILLFLLESFLFKQTRKNDEEMMMMMMMSRNHKCVVWVHFGCYTILGFHGFSIHHFTGPVLASNVVPFELVWNSNLCSRISNFQPTEDRELGVLDLGDERSWLSLAPEKSIDRPPAREHTAIVYDAEERVRLVKVMSGIDWGKKVLRYLPPPPRSLFFSSVFSCFFYFFILSYSFLCRKPKIQYCTWKWQKQVEKIGQD